MCFHLITFLLPFHQSHSQDWPQFGGPSRNFQVEDFDPAAPVAKDWRIALTRGDACPVVKEGVAYVLSADYAEDGTDAHRVHAINLDDGSLRWQVSYAEPSYISQDISDRYPVRPIATPVVVDQSLVYVGFGGVVRCLDTKDGSIRWSVDLVSAYSATPMQFGFTSSPIASSGIVAVACGGHDALVIGLDIESGRERWKCGNGPASFASFTNLSLQDGSSHWVYAAGDEVFGIDPNHGKTLWRYAYPKTGLTNAVTPIAVAPGLLLVAGQGIGGTALLSVENLQTSRELRAVEKWSNAKVQPFYCNWLQARSDPNVVVGFCGKTLVSLDWKTETVRSQHRGWTDCNLITVGNSLLAVRGDGLLASAILNETGISPVASTSTIQDRVWTPPVLVGSRLLVRGDRELRCLDIRSLAAGNELKAGTSITSMDAMYGQRIEQVDEFLERIKSKSANVTLADYEHLVSNRSVRLSEGDYGTILKELVAAKRSDLALSIASDWSRRDPDSIPAWQQRIKLLKEGGQNAMADAETESRLVRVKFLVTAPSVTADEMVYLAGNADGLGNWNGSSLALRREEDGHWSGSALLPRGRLEFKATKGSWETVEKRSDGRSTSNRRTLLRNSTTIQVIVQAFAEK